MNKKELARESWERATESSENFILIHRSAVCYAASRLELLKKSLLETLDAAEVMARIIVKHGLTIELEDATARKMAGFGKRANDTLRALDEGEGKE